MSDDLLLRGGRLASDLSTPTDVLVRDGTIVSIGLAGTTDAARVVDIDGAWLLPGVVDAHVHPIHAESFESVGAESVSGGITTALCHLYPEPGESFADAVARATTAAARGGADVGYHVRITPDRITSDLDLGELAAQPGVLSAKVFLAHADPTVRCPLGDLVRVMSATNAAELPLVVHAELGEVIEALEEVLGTPADLLAHDALRSEQLEASAVALVGAVVRMLDARAYIAHISSPMVAESLQLARLHGARLRGETCTHYLLLDHDVSPDVLGRVTPPLRSAETASRMRELAVRGAFAVLASDHCGYDEEEKPVDSFADAGNGLPGLDSMLAFMVDAVLGGDWISLPRAIELLCSGPAQTFGLMDKGAIKVGADADLVVIDPAGSTTVLDHPVGVASAASPYGGTLLRGALTDVVRRGEFAMRDRRVVGLAGGVPVTREVPLW